MFVNNNTANYDNFTPNNGNSVANRSSQLNQLKPS